MSFSAWLCSYLSCVCECTFVSFASVTLYIFCSCSPPAPFTILLLVHKSTLKKKQKNSKLFPIKILLMSFISTPTCGLFNLTAWHFSSYLKWIIHINESLDLSFLSSLEYTSALKEFWYILNVLSRTIRNELLSIKPVQIKLIFHWLLVSDWFWF